MRQHVVVRRTLPGFVVVRRYVGLSGGAVHIKRDDRSTFCGTPTRVHGRMVSTADSLDAATCDACRYVWFRR